MTDGIAWRRLDGADPHEAGLALLGELYREKTGQIMPEITRTSRGKPHFPPGMPYFSVSHTPRHVFCCLSDRPVGIDAEEADRKAPLHLAKRILSPRELARFSRAADPNGAFLRLWVLKEAAAKCAGTGLTREIDQTDFSPEDPRIRLLDGCYVAIVYGETEEKDAL